MSVRPAPATRASRRCATPYVAFVDSDVVVDPDASADCFGTCTIRRSRSSLRGSAASTVTTPGSAATKRHVHRSTSVATRPSFVPHSAIAWVPSAVVVARVDALGEGFDASMTVGEDVDLVWRLDAEGWRSGTTPTSSPGTTTAPPWAMARPQGLLRHRRRALAARHGAKVAPAVLTPIGAATAVASCSTALVRAGHGPAIRCHGLASTRAPNGGDHPVRTATELTALGDASQPCRSSCTFCFAIGGRPLRWAHCSPPGYDAR